MFSFFIRWGSWHLPHGLWAVLHQLRLDDGGQVWSTGHVPRNHHGLTPESLTRVDRGWTGTPTQIGTRSVADCSSAVSPSHTCLIALTCHGRFAENFHLLDEQGRVHEIADRGSGLRGCRRPETTATNGALVRWNIPALGGARYGM